MSLDVDLPKGPDACRLCGKQLHGETETHLLCAALESMGMDLG